MFNVRTRLEKIENRLTVKGIGQEYCNCGNGDARRTIWEKLMKPLDPENGEVMPAYVKPVCTLEASGEPCNPRPESKIRKYTAAERNRINQEITRKLMGEDWEEQKAKGHVAMESGPDALLQSRSVDDRGRAIEREQLYQEPPEPETTGDPIRDAVLARLKGTGQLDRVALAEKLLVKLPADEG